jgi:hypothetical protein
LKDAKAKSNLSEELEKIRTRSDARFKEIMQVVEGKLG